MENWTLSRDILDTVRRVAHDWTAGIVIIKPFNGDLLMLAVTNVVRYAPSNNIHYSTITGKDITLLIQQKLSIANPQGTTPVITYIDNIKEEQTWELTHNEQWYWVKVRVAY